MKIKRYTAVSMRAALALVRAEQGPDAVILSSRRGEDGIEVIAAVDYDEALFVEANRQRVPAVSTEAPTPAPTASPEPAVAPVRVQPTAARHQPPSRAQTPAVTPWPPMQAPSPTLIPASFRRLTVESLPAIVPALAPEPAPATTPAATRSAASARAPGT